MAATTEQRAQAAAGTSHAPASESGSSSAAQAAQVDKEGFLTKQSVWLKDWRRRYFKLIGNQLHFSKTPEEAPHGVIDLSSCLTVKSASDKTGKKYSFEVATPDQTFFMYADSEEEKDNWIGAVGRAIVKFSMVGRKPDQAAAAEEDDEVSSDEDGL